MKNFIKTLFEVDIRPFLNELLPAGSLLLQAFLFCFFVLLSSLCVVWAKERVAARIEMRDAKSMKQIVCRFLVLLLKRPAIPECAQKTLFVAAPLFAFVFALFFFFFLPVNRQYYLHSDFGLLYLLFASSCVSYAFIVGGWSSSTRFSFFGSMRLIAQSLCCQPVLALVIMTILMTAGASDLENVVLAQKNIWFIVPHFPLFVLYLLCVAMLLGQAPFESAKSKKELASGIYAEYSGSLYLLFLLAEDILLLLGGIVGSILFLGGTMPFGSANGWGAFVCLTLKTLLVIFILTLIKYAFPNWRTDKLLQMTFKLFVPFALLWLIMTAGALYFMQGAFA